MIRPQIYTRINEPDPGLMQEAAELGVADLHEGLGASVGRTLLMNPAMRPLDPTRTIAGPAVTGFNYPGDNLASHQALAFARKGHVIVLTNGGGHEGALFGELTGLQAIAKGVAGLVCHGAVRDTQALVAMGLPVWSTIVHASHPEKRGPASVNIPIMVDGVVVHPGDIIVADADGVLVIPPSLLNVAMRNARARREREVILRERMARGETLYDLLEIEKSVQVSGAEIHDGVWQRPEQASNH